MLELALSSPNAADAAASFPSLDTHTSGDRRPQCEPACAESAPGAAFANLGLPPALCAALAEEGYVVPTPIQAQAIPPILEGRDLLGCAQTGTGKTAAFTLPILTRLAATRIAAADSHPRSDGAPQRGRGGRREARQVAPGRSGRTPRALVLAPTRELAAQIGESVAAYGRHTGLVHAVVFGGVSQVPQEKALRRGVDILVATPGRLIDLMDQGLVDLSAVSVFVLDEADRMLDMGFIQPVRRIASALPRTRQTMLFSATMPKEVAALAESLLRDAVEIAVAKVSSAAARIAQRVYRVQRQQKLSLLAHLIDAEAIRRTIVFARTKRGADRLGKRLGQLGISAESIHGDKSQGQRERALAAFRSGRAEVLVATDVAARGIDVDGITHVFNFDLPAEPEAYVHRIGRTARAGAEGVAIAFCDAEEREQLRDIEKLIGHPLPEGRLPAGLRSIPVAVAEDPAGSRGGTSSSSSSAAPAPQRRSPIGGGPRTAKPADDRSSRRGAGAAPRVAESPAPSPRGRTPGKPLPKSSGAPAGKRAPRAGWHGAAPARPARTLGEWSRPTGRAR